MLLHKELQLPELNFVQDYLWAMLPDVLAQDERVDRIETVGDYEIQFHTSEFIQLDPQSDSHTPVRYLQLERNWRAWDDARGGIDPYSDLDGEVTYREVVIAPTHIYESSRHA